MVNMHCTLALESERAYNGFSFNEYPLRSHASDVPYVWELSSIGIGTMFHPYCDNMRTLMGRWRIFIFYSFAQKPEY